MTSVVGGKVVMRTVPPPLETVVVDRSSAPGKESTLRTSADASHQDRELAGTQLRMFICFSSICCGCAGGTLTDTGYMTQQPARPR